MWNAAKLIYLAGLTLALFPAGHAQVMKFGGCSIDFELMELPNCAARIQDGRPYVLKELAEYVLSRPQVGVAAWPVTVGRQRLAASHFPGDSWVYFDRRGIVVVKNVAEIDNGPADFHLGLVLVTRGEKWGLANARGQLVVRFTYDQIFDYEHNRGWLACTGCRKVRVDEEHFSAEGGKWVWLDAHGHVTGNATDPSSRIQ